MLESTRSNSDQNTLLKASTQLWIGQHEATVAYITQLLQSLFCLQGGCNICTACIQIRDHQHHAIMWLAPEKTYTKDQFDDLFSTLAFALDTNERYFFIIQHADFLTHACANRLLKSLEEPPHGYHFILIAERSDHVLMTVKSRCMIHEYAEKKEIEPHSLFHYFTQTPIGNSLEFLKTLEQSKITEQESIALLDALMQYWINRYKTPHNHKKSEKVIAILAQAFTQLPMPGSSKIFWKNLYLQMG